MAHIGTLRDFRFQGDVDDIRGANLYGRDGEKLGEVSDVIFDHATCTVQYLVVDTGGMFKSREFLVPADRINTHSQNNKDFSCDLTKAQIERFPEYNGEATHEHNEDWNNYESRYRESYVTDGDVLHRAGSDHMITPEASELPPASGDGSGVDYTPTRISDPFKQPNNPMRDDVRLRPAGTMARAEDASIPGTSISTESAQWERRALVDQGRVEQGRVEQRDINDIDIHRADVVPIDRDVRSSAPEEIRDLDMEDVRDRSAIDNSAYGDRDVVVPTPRPQDPPSYRVHDEAVDPHAGHQYPSVRVGTNDAERLREHNRLRDFEDNLRRNRVDITASCRSCAVEKDRAA